MKQEELKDILYNHEAWLDDPRRGALADLSGADLIRADLSGANLRRADLSGANLRRANLKRADLSGACLSGAYLRRTYLREANLSEAYLREANLRRADLSGANLRRADLSGADLSGANLSGANLSESLGVEYAQCSFDKHGERGRQLLAVKHPKGIIFYCGCFIGDEAALRAYIADISKTNLRKSRLLAVDFLIATLNLEA